MNGNIDRPVIPETITVHLGAPDQAAENVTIPFAEYIKNVASSEIYPTWPGGRHPGQYPRANQLRPQSDLYRALSQPGI